MAQLALVTGGAVRIGKAVALRLAGEGYDIALQFRNSSAEAEAAAAAIRAKGARAECFRADLTKDEDVAALIPAVNATLGCASCLVNNASHFADDRLPALTPQGWDAHMAINLKAPVFLAQAFAAQLPADRCGNVINIIDQRVLRPNPQFFSYTVSKSALWAATKTMAQALAPRIRVNAIGPGPALGSIYQTPDDFERENRSTLLGRGTTPDEIAKTVLLILGTPAMTGQMIALDGGQHLLWQTPDIRVT